MWKTEHVVHQRCRVTHCVYVCYKMLPKSKYCFSSGRYQDKHDSQLVGTKQDIITHWTSLALKQVIRGYQARARFRERLDRHLNACTIQQCLRLRASKRELERRRRNRRVTSQSINIGVNPATLKPNFRRPQYHSNRCNAVGTQIIKLSSTT